MGIVNVKEEGRRDEEQKEEEGGEKSHIYSNRLIRGLVTAAVVL